MPETIDRRRRYLILSAAAASLLATAKPGQARNDEVLVPFDHESFRLPRAILAALDQVAAGLAADPKAEVQVTGHAAENEAAAYNLGLRRASAVRDYLIKNGVDAGRVRTVSFGAEKPVAQGSDESAWQKNRRALLRFR